MTSSNEIKTLAALGKPGRGKVYDNIAETIANTPLVRLSRLKAEAGAKADILLKLEFFNPLQSVKDRIGVSMIDTLEASGKLKPGGTLVEPTSGNTGIGLAFVAAARGYKLILTMPESMSIERRKILAHLGATIVLTAREKGMKGAIAKAEEIALRLCKASHTAVRWTKYSLNNWLRMAGPTFDTSLALEFMGFAGPDVREGVSSIREKRAPNFAPKSPF